MAEKIRTEKADNLIKYLYTKIESLEARMSEFEKSQRYKNKESDRSANKQQQMTTHDKAKQQSLPFILPSKVEKSIILFGVPSSSAATEEERALQDEHETLEIFKEIGFNLRENASYGEIKINRLTTDSFKIKTSSPPIKVSIDVWDFNANDLPMEVKAAAKRLRKSNKYKEVILGVNLSESQISNLMRLMKIKNELVKQLDKATVYRFNKKDEIVVSQRRKKGLKISVLIQVHHF